MSCRDLFQLVILVPSLGALGLSGCGSNRDRPTGLGQPLPPTSVAVVQPQADALLPVDSLRPILVEAEGSLLAVALYVRRPSIADTIMQERRVFMTEQRTVQEEFMLRVPRFVTGTHLEIRAVVEDLIGQLHESEPVFVQVIECDVFPLSCGDI